MITFELIFLIPNLDWQNNDLFFRIKHKKLCANTLFSEQEL